MRDPHGSTPPLLTPPLLRSKEEKMSFDPNAAPLVPETLLKRRRTLDELQQKRADTVQKQVKRRRVVRGENVVLKRPEQFVRENKIKEGSSNKMNRRKRESTRRTTLAIPRSELKDTVGFVIRIHAGRHASPEIKNELRSLGLTKKYDGVFMKLDKETISRLKAIDAYVAYGYISHSSVSELIHRRTYTQFVGSKSKISSNICVEKALGDKDLLCLNDLVHELYTVGNHFTDVLGLLCTYRLSAPVGHYEKKILAVNDKVEEKGGFLCGTDMDDFLKKIL